MIRVSQIKMKTKHSMADLEEAVKKCLHLRDEDLISMEIEKKSLDARKKPTLFYVYSVAVEVKNEKALLEKLNRKKKQANIQAITRKKYQISVSGANALEHPPVIIGSGPAGLFCAYELAKQGFKPLLLERGTCVEDRVLDVEKFWETGILNPESNVQFGEGGAGTFSDGKLNTGVKDPLGRNREILETFVQFGAPESILYDGKPHIGTDILTKIVSGMREQIIAWGGEVRFKSKVTSIEMCTSNGKRVVTGVTVNNKDLISTQVAVLAIGNGARDTFEYLQQEKVPMEAKPFAIGVRIEHKQHLINESQYGIGYDTNLEPSPYKLTANLGTGRGVYSFCMCPGGYVVNASSEEGGLAVNGMSYSDRGSENANSAIVVTIKPDDYGTEHPLKGMELQREIEQKAYEIGGGKVPVQLWGDYVENRASEALLSVIPQIKGEYILTNVRQILPSYIADSIADGMEVFGRKIKGFNANDVILSGVETRTSSPVKLPRNENFESEILGLYPCGEGAGYAGGITSAAMDGLKVFESIVGTYYSTK